MTERLKRIVVALSIGTALAIVTNFVELILARHGLGPSDTILDDVLIGFAAALSAYAWAELLAERESRRHVKTEQEATIRERTRVACEIHDVIAQSFAGLIYNVESAHEFLPDSSQGKEFCQRALRVAREGLAESRRLMRTVRSPIVNAEDLHSAITELVHLLTEGEQLQTTFNVDGDFAALSPEIEGQLLRIVREAVTNVVRHAKASELSVNLGVQHGNVEMSIVDDGCGFVPGAVNNGETFGLTSMQERAQDLGGSLSVISEPGEGTRVVASIPISAQIVNRSTGRQSAKVASAR